LYDSFILTGYGTIGGDDKCGIYIILYYLKYISKDINFLFTVGEEVGGIGSKHFVINNKNIKKENNIPYGLVLDRRGNCDIICANNGYGVLEFEEALKKVGKKFNYKDATGTFSDADYLSKLFSCANLSVGYNNPHTNSEFVDIEDLHSAIEFVATIVTEVNETFKTPDITMRHRGMGIYSDYFRGLDDDIEYHESVIKEGIDYDNLICPVCGSFMSDGSVRISSINMIICGKCYDKLELEIGLDGCEKLPPIKEDFDELCNQDFDEIKNWE
jgi:ribosomal protein S27AE